MCVQRKFNLVQGRTYVYVNMYARTTWRCKYRGFIYSKACLKRPLKHRQKTHTILLTNGMLKVESIAECSPWSILQYFRTVLSDNRSWKPFFVFFLSCCLRRLYRCRGFVCSVWLWYFLIILTLFFTLFIIWFWKKMQIIALGCVPWWLILALWNALKPFSTTGLHPWSHTGGYPRPFQECVLYKMPHERACSLFIHTVWRVLLRGCAKWSTCVSCAGHWLN